MSRNYPSGWTALVCLIGSLTVTNCGSEAPLVTLPQETVEGTRIGANGRTWHTAFDVMLTGTTVEITVRVRLIPAPELSRTQIERVKAVWEEGVERSWSERFGLQIGKHPETVVRPMQLDLDFVNARAHHTVILHDHSPAQVDQLNWSRWSSADVIAHEVGHMLGAYDEYSGGSQDPETPREDRASIMGNADSADRAFAPRHFETIRSWVAHRLGPEQTVDVVRWIGNQNDAPAIRR